MKSAQTVIEKVTKLGRPKRAKTSQRFFKTGPGQYGEGDIFIGLIVPELRKLAKLHDDLTLPEVTKLLQSPIHEIRFLAIVILVNAFQKGDDRLRASIAKLYLKSIKKYINNWDLVDVSAPQIVGGYLADKPKDILFDLARSTSLWERRVAMLATFYFIRKGESELALKIAAILANDKHDLIQKAVGWMLREVGKACGAEIEEQFLEKHANTMPRTMLRYAIERFPPQRRLHFLKKKGKIDKSVKNV
jgi:3-methyladenine DNA glycosylase AlkD